MYYAAFGKRFIAFLLDMVLLSVLTGILGRIFGFNATAVTQMMETQPFQFGLLSTLLASDGVIRLLYFTLMESSERQATVGKMVMGLRVVGEDNNRLSFMRAAGRNLAKYLSGFILMIGYIMAAFTSKRQGLHDMLASTFVVDSKMELEELGYLQN